MGAAFGDEALEFGVFFLMAAKQARFLDGEVVEIAAVGEEDLRFDQVFADGFIGFVGELGGEFAAADGEDAGFEGRDAVQAPEGVGYGLG